MKLLSLLTRRGTSAALLAGILGLGGLALGSGAQAATSEGLDCETDAHQTFSLTARDGYVSTPDGNSIYMWSYGMSSGRFQLPGPTLCVTSGQPVTIVLHNSLVEPTSIVFAGQRGVKADGKPAQPELTDTGSMSSMVQAADANDGSVTYTFTAGKPGTYLYASGSDVNKQRQMGLFGALVVRPDGHPDQVNDRSDSRFDTDHEYVFLLSEVDPDLHLAVENGEPVDWSSYRARYFMINGRSMPDTLAPNHASWLPHQPYGGTVNYPFHPHGSDERVVNIDGKALTGASDQDLSYVKFDIDVQPGQSVDALMDWRDVEHWDPTTNPIPTTLPALQDQVLVGTDTWFSESPYLGAKNGLPKNITSNNECGEYYHVAHSHALEQATNFGATFGGMMTVFRIDPPAGCPTN
jgi:FtsP/CotA-like multicopper oxidase with cupredoxin domain